MPALLHLILIFGLLSLLAVGGGTAVLPEMQIMLARQFGIDHTSFVHVYSLGQLAPGPNMLMVVVFGSQVAGIAGAGIVMLAFFLPSSVLCLWVGRFWAGVGDRPWRRAAQNALEPISIGLMCSGVYAVAKNAVLGPLSAALSAISFALIIFTRINPAIVILGAGLLGGSLMLMSGLR
jgi:chromate transporter